MEIFEKEFNGCRVVTFAPQNKRGVLVWFHGGGWIVELGKDALAWGQALAEATGLEVRMPDYPLAHGNVRSREINAWCRTYWEAAWSRENGDLYLGGDSAGAQLAMLAMGEKLPKKAAFVYAVTTFSPDREHGSWSAYRKDWALSPRLMEYFFKAYCPEESEREDNSPLSRLTAMPPTLLVTAGEDILADQQTALAKRFDLEQKVYTEAKHVFLSRPDGAEYRAQALADISNFLKN